MCLWKAFILIMGYGSWTSCSMGAKGRKIIIFESKEKKETMFLIIVIIKYIVNHKKFSESKSLLKFKRKKKLQKFIKYHYVNFTNSIKIQAKIILKL